MDPWERPRAFLPSGPCISWPCTTMPFQSKSLGNNIDMHCRPVQAGPGKCGSGNVAPSTHIRMLHISALSSVTPGLVIMYDDNNESCTIPMTGLLDCGVIMFCATDMSSNASALDSNVCSACKFISSPS